MSARLRPKAWGQVKPTPGYGIDWGHPLAKDLLLCYLFNGVGGLPTNVARGRRASAVSGATWGVSLGGESLNFSTGADSFSDTVVPAELQLAATDPFTIEVIVYVTATPSLSYYFGIGSDPNSAPTGGTRRSLFSFGGAANDHIYFWGENQDLDSGISWRTDGSKQHVVVTSDGTGNFDSMFFYRDGFQIGYGQTPATLITCTGEVWAGSHHPSGTNAPTMRMTKAALYKRKLTKDEVTWLYQEPYAMVVPLAMYSSGQPSPIVVHQIHQAVR